MRKLPKFSAMLGFVFMFLLFTGTSGKHEADKTIIKVFNVHPPADLYLDNEFGDLEVSVWNKSAIEIEVEIQAYSGSKSNAEKFVNETTIDFTQEGNKVYAKTKLGQRKQESKWYSWFRNTNQTYEVNYKVRIPEYTNLDIENEHGDIVLEQYDGDLELELSYGTLKAGNISGLAEISIKHGEAKVQGLDNGELEIYYSEFKTQSAGNLDIKSTNSEISIPSALNLTIFSKYDEYQIGQIDNFVNEGAYDEFKIAKARSINITSRFTELTASICEFRLNADVAHGEVDVKRVSTAFDGGKIESNDADFRINFDGNARLDIIAEHTSVDLSPDFNDNSEIVGANKKHIVAYKGKNPNAAALIGNLKHGSLKVR